MFSVLVVVVALVTAIGRCGSVTGRLAGARRPPSTFTETIAPIVYANCVTCHRAGEAAPFSLISYEDVAKRAQADRRSDRVAVHAAVARGARVWRVRRRAAV